MPDVEMDSSPSLYRALVESALNIITLIDKDGVIKYQSPSIEEHFGYTPAEVLGMNVLDLVHEDDHAIALDSLQKIASGAKNQSALRFRFRHKNQTWHFVEVVGKLLQGEISGIVLDMRDITQRENMLAALRQSEESFQAAFNATSSICTISIAKTGEFINVNDAWVKAMEWTRQEAVGKTAIDLNVWGNAENRKRVLDALRQQGSLQQFKADIYSKSGQRRRLLIDAEYLTLQGDRRMFISAVDITEREVLEEQLRQSQKIEAVGQLTGGIAHDFNNLLSVILGHADLASLKAEANPEVLQSLDAIIRSAESGAELIQQLLSFSRKQKLNPKCFALVACITKMRTLLQTSVGKEVTIRIKDNGGDWLCNLDPVQMESALLNMSINARDAMPNGGYLRFHISELSLEEQRARILNLKPGDYVQLDIIDEGKGMSPEVIEHAFEPFFTTKSSERGTGLGLSMVYGFVKQSGGHISISSGTQGSGTTMTLLLPRAEVEPQRTRQNDERCIQEQQDKRVLLVEDDEDVRSLVAKLLESLKLEVIEAANGAEAEGLMVEPFDLLVSDVMLPGGVKGPDVARNLREIQPGVAVLYMSGFHPDVLSQEELAQKGVDFIQKPFSRDDFSSKIESLLHD